MSSITDTIAGDHRRCDEIFAEAEELVAQQDWTEARGAYQDFQQALEGHFAAEEGVLFPGFEQRTGNAMGPTQVMRMEHSQMRHLLAEMTAAVEVEDAERYLGLSETLMMIMQQHNMKEEQMLYPMTDQAFAGETESLLSQLELTT